MHLDILNPRDNDQLLAYERAFHQAFVRASTNRLVRDLWQWNDAELRLATRIPYADQLVMVQYNPAGRLVAAMSLNVAMHQFQAAAFGFSSNQPGAPHAEVLTIFSVGDFQLSKRRSLVDACKNLARDRGFATLLATAAPRPAAAYCRYFGAVELERRQIGDEWRVFTSFPLALGDQH